MFAENLKKYRKLAGLRQDDVARVIGLDRSAYAYYENGKTEPSIDNLKRIAMAFGVDINTLVDFGTSQHACEFCNEPQGGYSAPGIISEMDLSKCSADERTIIACYRACSDKGAFLALVNEMYEAELKK